MSSFKVWRDWWTYHWNCNKPAVLLRVGLISTCFLLAPLLDSAPAQHEGTSFEHQKAWIHLALLVVSIGLSLLAGKMLAPKNPSPIKDDKPTTLTTRGSYCNWFMGIRRVGPVFCWADDRSINKEKIEGGGKGGDDPEAEIFYEAGWHVLGIGPVWALHKIIQSGKVIFEGPITADSHPSGTTVSLGKEGSFTIYWGEPDQPVNNFLGNANRVTISSRWPYICYIVWNKKRMGPSPQWPLLDYVLERRPATSLLTQSDGWYDPGLTLQSTSFAITDNLEDGDEQVGYLQIAGSHGNRFEPTTFVEISGNAIGSGTYEVLKSEVVTIGSESPSLNPPTPPVTVTRIYLQGGTSGSDDQGSIQKYDEDLTDGANIAHVIADLLFAEFPQGLQIDPDHLVEKWDLESLEDLGVEAETDSWRASVLATEGETAEALFGAMLQDHGVMLPLSNTSGNIYFQRVRFPEGTLASLPQELLADNLPEIESMHGEKPVDRLIFTFSDRENQFGDMTIAVDDDGQASYMEHQRARKVPVVSTVLFRTAAQLSELRSGEELSQGAEFRIDAGREARNLMPGQAILVEGFDEVLRVLAVEIDPLSEKVQLKVIPDFYGARKSDFVTNQGGGPPELEDPELDEHFAWMEAPEQVLGGFPSTITVFVPRIRANSSISFASLHLSRDNTTYTLYGNDSYVQTGGVLETALPADGPTFEAQGPEYTEKGPDNSSLTQDLSSDLTNWGLGRQLCVIQSSAGIEICYLQRTTITGGDTRRLDGLLRARYDTRKLSHPIGARVYIFDRDLITPVQDVLLETGENLYVKTQPGTTAGQVDLSIVPGYGDTLVGKGQVPITPDYVHLRAPYRNVPAFKTGQNITLSWAVSTGSVSTGCGAQPAGTAIGPAEIPGTIQIELLTTGDVLQDTLGVAADVGEREITNAELVAAFGSEPSSFKVRIKHVANGATSNPSPSLTITRI